MARLGRFARWCRRSCLSACSLLIWGGMWLQVRLERIATERDVLKETSNLALAFEENIVRSINAIDQVILFLRDSYARDPARFDLLTWARERPFINDQTFQFSLVDASGGLVQSNLAATRQLVNLSDREHFRVHVGARPESVHQPAVTRSCVEPLLRAVHPADRWPRRRISRRRCGVGRSLLPCTVLRFVAAWSRLRHAGRAGWLPACRPAGNRDCSAARSPSCDCPNERRLAITAATRWKPR